MFRNPILLIRIWSLAKLQHFSSSFIELLKECKRLVIWLVV